MKILPESLPLSLIAALDGEEDEQQGGDKNPPDRDRSKESMVLHISISPGRFPARRPATWQLTDDYGFSDSFPTVKLYGSTLVEG